MRVEEKRSVFTELQKLSIILGGKESTEQLRLITEILSDYDFSKVVKAIRQGAAEFKFFPKPVELIGIINPPVLKEDANAIVSKIFQAIRDFGYMNPARAQDFLGEIAWNTVQGLGGWRDICLFSGSEATQRAQMRDMAQSMLNSPSVARRLLARENEIRENKKKNGPELKLLDFGKSKHAREAEK